MIHMNNDDEEIVITSNENSIKEMGSRSQKEAMHNERRRILARLGKMAALTTPAVVTLMLSQRASAAS